PAGFPPLTHVPFPPQCRGDHRLLFPGRKKALQSTNFSLPIDGRETHVAAVPDQVDEFGLGPDEMEGREIPNVIRRLVANQGLTPEIPIVIEYLCNEGRIGDLAFASK